MKRTTVSGGTRLLTLSVLVVATLLSSFSPAGAQVPELPDPHPPAYKQIALDVESTYLEVDFLGRATVPFTITDFSRDSTRQPGAEAAPAAGARRSTVLVTTEFEDQKPGWMASSTLSAAFLYGGQSARGEFFIQTAGNVRDQFVHVWLNATTTLPNGTVVVESERITARILPFYRGLVQIREPSRMVGQYEDVVFQVEVFNAGAYPDTFQLNVTAPPGYLAHVQPKVYVQPFETRLVNLTLKTPKDKMYDLGTPGTVIVQMKSVNSPTNYESVASVYVRGPYVSSTIYPLTLLGIVAIGLLVNRGLSDRELAALEKGKPRRPRPTPRQQVVLKELKRRDPDSYKEKAGILAGVYKARRQEYRERHRDNARLEREERKKARAELQQERRERKAALAEEKRLAKVEAKRERAVRKVTRKKRRALLKEKRKLEKKRAKLAAKEAKARAKDEKKRAKEEAKSAKRAARAAKKQKKSRK